MDPSHSRFWNAVDQIRARDDRYRPEAYGFVVGALGIAVSRLPQERLDDPLRRHLTGQELLASIINVARHEFGPLAATVFREWGVASGGDVGAIVFQLIAAGELTARPEDTLADFTDGPDLLRALDAPDPTSARR